MRKPSITTYSGLQVNPLNLRPKDIRVIDIAHHLACLNRWVGALKIPISIAQHSVDVSYLLKGSDWEPEGLFHDATEAYLGDVSKWLKESPEMRDYREAEGRAWQVICKALNLDERGDPNVNPHVRRADNLMVRFEAFTLSKDHPLFKRSSHPPLTREEFLEIGQWKPWDWKKSESEFLSCAKRLGF